MNGAVLSNKFHAGNGDDGKHYWLALAYDAACLEARGSLATTNASLGLLLEAA